MTLVRAAVERLGRARGSRAPDPTQRLRAVAALPEEPTSRAALLVAAEDPSPDVAAAALVRLGRLGGTAEARLLRRGLLGCDLAVVRVQARTLRALDDDEAVTVAEYALRDPLRDRRLHAAIALEVLARPASAPALRAALGDDVPAVRRSAIATLVRLEQSDANAVLFARLLSDPSAQVRAAAVHAIGASVRAPRALLAPAVADPDARVRRAVARLGAKAADPAALLLDHDIEVRRAAARAGGEIEHLARVLRDDPSPAVRQAATRALGEHRHSTAVTPLLCALADEHVSVRVAALAALETRLGRGEASALIGTVLASPSPRARAAALRALVRLDATVPAAVLRPLCDDPDADVRLTLAHGAEIIAAAPRALLVRLADDPDRTVRHAATMRLDRLALADRHRRARAGARTR